MTGATWSVAATPACIPPGQRGSLLDKEEVHCTPGAEWHFQTWSDSVFFSRSILQDNVLRNVLCEMMFCTLTTLGIHCIFFNLSPRPLHVEMGGQEWGRSCFCLLTTFLNIFRSRVASVGPRPAKTALPSVFPAPSRRPQLLGSHNIMSFLCPSDLRVLFPIASYSHAVTLTVTLIHKRCFGNARSGDKISTHTHTQRLSKIQISTISAR